MRKGKKYIVCFGCGKQVRRHKRGHPSAGVCWRRSCRRAWRRDQRETREAARWQRDQKKIRDKSR